MGAAVPQQCRSAAVLLRWLADTPLTPIEAISHFASFLFVVCRLSFVVCRSSFVVVCLSLVVCRWRLVVGRLSLVVGRWSLEVGH